MSRKKLRARSRSPLIRPALGQAAHQLEGAEGVVALAAEGPQHGAAPLTGQLLQLPGALSHAAPVGADEEHRLAMGQILLGGV